MDLWNIPNDAIRQAAARKTGLPLWRMGSVSVTTGLWATAQVLAGPVVTIYPHDIRFDDMNVRNEAGAVPLKEVP